jgi:hypothetical protein
VPGGKGEGRCRCTIESPRSLPEDLLHRSRLFRQRITGSGAGDPKDPSLRRNNAYVQPRSLVMCWMTLSALGVNYNGEDRQLPILSVLTNKDDTEHQTMPK